MNPDVAKIILKHWGLASAVRPETSGGSRATWQLDNGDWLSRSEAADAESFQSEARLLGLLRESLLAQSPAIAVPEIVKDLSGSDLVTDAGYVWRMTKNMAGTKRPASDLRTYPVLVEALDVLHAALKAVPPHHVPVKLGVVESLPDLFERRDEPPIVTQALAWLEPRLDTLATGPVTVTHGDFNPTNVIYESRGRLAVAGILDFELSRPDPAVMDYSQLLTMLVCHSGVPNLAEEAARLYSRLEDRFTARQLCTAMVAYWVELYDRWKWHPAAEAKFRMRLSQVLDFVKRPSSGST